MPNDLLTLNIDPAVLPYRVGTRERIIDKNWPFGSRGHLLILANCPPRQVVQNSREFKRFLLHPTACVAHNEFVHLRPAGTISVRRPQRESAKAVHFGKRDQRLCVRNGELIRDGVLRSHHWGCADFAPEFSRLQLVARPLIGTV
ncbi:unannotated protein [freshwater metagenome]|uniref:Unannotated protein n=1 Tax=freshwater metagenome TaxID=449393 RepID=A0A6J7UUP5_9ZZZZ